MARQEDDDVVLFPAELAKLLPYRKCLSGEEKKDRIALIPAAMDFWNNDHNYWDRRTKYDKMLGDPYTFYRGTCQLYWFDFGKDERLTMFGNEHTVTWLCGDYHAYNAGSFDRGEKNQVVYGLNDFDESVVADYQLDLWRLATSIKLIVRENDDNLSEEDLIKVLDAMSHTYLERMRHFVQHKSAIQEQITKDNAYGKLKDFLKVIENKATREKMLDKWCPEAQDGTRQFDVLSAKLGSATLEEKRMILNAMEQYQSTLENPSDLQVIDIARRLLAGTGSLGLDRYYILVKDNKDGVERILDVKEQPKPSPYHYMDKTAKVDYDTHVKDNDALRVVNAHRKLSLSPDPFMGWMKLKDKYYSVDERSPFKGSFPALLTEAHGKYKDCKLDSAKRYQKLAEQWAWVLATHHAYAMRDKKEQVSLEQAIVDAVGNRDTEFKTLVNAIAMEYADQVVSDWKSSAGLLGADVGADGQAIS